MGKGGKITIGYWYSGTFHMGLCHKSLDAIYEIRGDDKRMFPLQRRFAIPVLNEVLSPPPGPLPGPITASGAVSIDAPTLYGGEKQEGGVQGTLTVLMGEGSQVPSPALAAIEAGPRPAYLDITTCAFTGKIAAINPYIKPWRFRVGRYLQGWDGGSAWQPTLAQVGRGMNAAHIVYQCLTDRSWGASEDAASGLDLDSFLAAAQTLKDEDLGLCLKWSMSDSIGSFVGLVLDHVAGLRYIDPATNKLGIRLLRGDYDVATLATDPANLLDETDIVEMTSYQYPVINETVNEVTVRYRDVDTNKDAAVTYQNLANVQAQGKVVSETVDYRGFYKAEQGARAAARDCHSKSALLVKGQCKVKSSRWKIKVGDVLLLSWAREKCVRMPIRVLKVDYGDATARTLTLSWAQDEFGVPASTYVQPSAGQWQEPDTAPTPITLQRVIEAPYRELARTLDAGTVNALAPESGYLMSMGARPAAGVATNYELVTRTGTANFKMRAAGDFSPRGTLAVALAPLDTSISLSAFAALDLVATGTAALIDDELVRVDAIDASAGTATIARGCADTVPAAHAAGTVVWFFEDYTGNDRTEYLTGESIDAKLLTVASQGMLDPALAITLTTVLKQRQARPYPPGNLQVQGTRYPAAISGPLALSWSHRDRTVTADQLVDTLQGDVGPEAGTTYTVRVYLDGVLDSTTAGITGNSVTPSVSGSGTVRVEVEAVRDGLASWQPQTATFAYTAGTVVASLLHFDGTDASTSFVDQTGKTWTANGNAQIDTGNSKFGGASLQLDGSGDWINTSAGAAYNFGVGDFTIEGWVYIDSTAGSGIHWLISAFASNSAGGWSFGARHGSFGGVMRFFDYVSNTGFNGTTAVAVGGWHHVAATRQSGTLRLFLDGVKQFEGALSANYPTPAAVVIGGSGQLPPSQVSIACHNDEVRVTKGQALYTANFTPPAAPFPNP